MSRDGGRTVQERVLASQQVESKDTFMKQSSANSGSQGGRGGEPLFCFVSFIKDTQKSEHEENSASKMLDTSAGSF